MRPEGWRCDMCAWYEPDIYGNASGKEGRCHRAPPLMQEDGYGVFPAVDENEWCGEFKDKEE